MSLLQEWREYAYSEEMQNSKEGEQLWNNYFQLEKGIYEKLLTNPTEVVTGTVEGLAEKYEVPLSMMVGFLDGINDSLKEPNPIDTMEKDTEIKLDIDCEKLYYNMANKQINIRRNCNEKQVVGCVACSAAAFWHSGWRASRECGGYGFHQRRLELPRAERW